MPKRLSKSRVAAYTLVLLAYAAVIVSVIHWSTHGQLLLSLQYQLLRGIAQRYQVADLTVIMDDPPIRMFLNPDDKVITFHIEQTGLWESKETDLFLSNVTGGDTVLDVGANVGYYTLVAARLVGEKGRVFAFEPDPINFDLLDRNVRLNGIESAVLEPLALSNRRGKIKLYLSSQNKGDHRIYPSEDRQPFVEVPLDTLDDYFEQKDIRIDFLKIDTQGAEPAILKGGEKLLRANKNIRMFVEFWPYGFEQFGSSAKECLDLLQSLDFLFFDVGSMTAKRPKLRPVEASELLRRYTVENQVHTTLYAVKGLAEFRRLTSQLSLRSGSVDSDPAAPRSPESQRAYQAAEESLNDFLIRSTSKR